MSFYNPLPVSLVISLLNLKDDYIKSDQCAECEKLFKQENKRNSTVRHKRMIARPGPECEACNDMEVVDVARCNSRTMEIEHDTEQSACHECSEKLQDDYECAMESQAEAEREERYINKREAQNEQ